nr:MAG: DNA pilot protein [Microvirus Sku113]
MDVGGILTGVGGILGAGANIFSNIFNAQQTQQMNDFNKNQWWGQNSQLFDTLVDNKDNKVSYVEAYLRNAHRGEWTERMNPQHLLSMVQLDREDNALQRKVADARKAGINPFYALGGTGSAAGAVAGNFQAPTQQAPQMNFDALTTSIMDVLSNIDLKQSQSKNIQADTLKKEAETGKITIDTMLSTKAIDLTDAQINKLQAEYSQILASTNLTEKQIQQLDELIGAIQYDISKSHDLGIRYKDTISTAGYVVNSLDSFLRSTGISESAKDAVIVAGSALAFATGGKKLMKSGLKILKKGYDKGRGYVEKFYKNTFGSKKGD